MKSNLDFSESLKKKFFEDPALKVSPSQREAICHINGPCMVLAGPGSGKTFVITNRIRYLIEIGKIDPSEILIITFTKAAALEMQKRFGNMTDNRYNEVHFGTFHSLFYHIIRSSLSGNRQEILTEKEKIKIMEHSLLKVKADNAEIIKLQKDFEYDMETIRALLLEISKLKNSGKSVESASKDVPLSNYFEQIFDEYCILQKELNKIDFDDMVLDCYKLLRKGGRTLSKWQNTYKYILIDEFQDINLLQFKLIRLIAYPRNNLFVVGDDDQSIYGFRGSDPKIMLGFKKIYERALIVFLETNYRCSKKIVNASVKLIGENENRFSKKIIPLNTAIDGEISFYKYRSREEEFEDILYYLKANPLHRENFAIIFRTNQEAANMAKMLKQNGISYNIREKNDNLQNDEITQDILAYLRFAIEADPKRADFIRIMNRPLRYIKRDSFFDPNSDRVSQNVIMRYYANNPEMLKTINKLYHDLKMIGHMRPYLSVRYIRKEIGYEEYAIRKFKGQDRSLIISKLDRLMDRAREYRNTLQFIKSFDDDKEIITVPKDEPKSGINLLTMHAAKGLEYESVWLPDLNEGIIPGRKSVRLNEIEEERRMLYVGMTRAKKNLMLSYVTGTGNNEMLPSRFINIFKEDFNKTK